MVEREFSNGVELSELLDTVHEVLSDRDRRSVIGRLAEAGHSLDVDHLAAAVVAARRGRPVDAVNPDQYERTVVSLVHVHLPKLHETGFVEWDREASTVAIAPMVEELSTTAPVAGGLVDASIAHPEPTEE